MLPYFRRSGAQADIEKIIDDAHFLFTDNNTYFADL
jgi:hypothetical protein